MLAANSPIKERLDHFDGGPGKVCVIEVSLRRNFCLLEALHQIVPDGAKRGVCGVPSSVLKGNNKGLRHEVHGADPGDEVLAFFVGHARRMPAGRGLVERAA